MTENPDEPVMQGVTNDNIEWTAPVKDATSGRFELHFRNLTRAEAVQLLMTLDKLQTDRKTALYLCDALSINEASKPHTAAREFARSQGLTVETAHATAARDFTAAHNLDPKDFFK